MLTYAFKRDSLWLFVIIRIWIIIHRMDLNRFSKVYRVSLWWGITIATFLFHYHWKCKSPPIYFHLNRNNTFNEFIYFTVLMTLCVWIIYCYLWAFVNKFYSFSTISSYFFLLIILLIFYVNYSHVCIDFPAHFRHLCIQFHQFSIQFRPKKLTVFKSKVQFRQIVIYIRVLSINLKIQQSNSSIVTDSSVSLGE